MNVLKNFILEKPGIIIINAQVSVIRLPSDIAQEELIRFVIDTTPQPDGLMNGYILDNEFEQINRQVIKYESIDEFFALSKYFTRNGVTKQ